MKLREPFVINDQSFTRSELVRHGNRIVSDESSMEWERDIYRFILDFLDEKVHLTQKTSGTTGDPKSIVMDRDAMLASAGMTLEHFGIRPGARALLCLPVHYIAGKMMIVRALAGNLTLVCLEPSGSPLKGAEISFDFAAMVPLQVYESINDGSLEDRDATLLIGGGEVSKNLRNSLAAFRHLKTFETFAMTETYSHFAVRKINGSDPDSRFRIMKGVSIATDERGCLNVSMDGITPEPVLSNDLVRIYDDNSFKWLGRFDNVIKSGGIKIIPELLEARITELTGIQSIILGFPDEKLGKKLVLVFETTEKDPGINNFRNLFTKNLQKYELPKEIFAVKEFPRNSGMKVDREALAGLLKKKHP